MSANSPLFSVILPVYNRSGLIERTVRSILNQEYADFELVIVDDGSTDDTAEVIKGISDPRISFYQTINEERAAARNFGAAKSSGKYLNFFDSDDKMYSSHLRSAANFIKNNPECRFFHHGYDIVDEQGKIVSTEKGASSEPAKRLIKTNYLGCDSVFILRTVFEEVRFNPDRRLSSSEDWELWLKVISRYPLLNAGTVTFQMINHSGRSLFTISADKVIERDTVLVESLLNDPSFVTRFKNETGLFKADRNTFFALCLIVENRPREAYTFLVCSVKCSLKVLSRKRFWACVKHLALNLFK